MKKKYQKADEAIRKFATSYFKQHIEPDIKKAMLKLDIVKIDDMNNYTFFTLKDGSTLIDSKFNNKQQTFYDMYISPLYERNNLLHCIDIKIEA